MDVPKENNLIMKTRDVKLREVKKVLLCGNEGQREYVVKETNSKGQELSRYNA